MKDIVLWLATPAGSTLVGGVVVMYVLQIIKKSFNWQPGGDTIVKQITTLAVSAIAGIGLWLAGGQSFEWGIWITKVIEVFLGATTLHALIPAAAGGRSKESRAPGVVE